MRARERETRIIILCVLTYIGPIVECACFSTIMYWSAHVGTQENGWHDVMKNAKQSPNNISHDPIATAIGNKVELY